MIAKLPKSREGHDRYRPAEEKDEVELLFGNVCHTLLIDIPYAAERVTGRGVVVTLTAEKEGVANAEVAVTEGKDIQRIIEVFEYLTKIY